MAMGNSGVGARAFAARPIDPHGLSPRGSVVGLAADVPARRIGVRTGDLPVHGARSSSDRARADLGQLHRSGVRHAGARGLRGSGTAGSIRGGARAACRARHTLDARMKLDLEGYEVLPGFINAHDHLEFNLFPRLGAGPYRNATEWARDIYHPE